MLFSTKGKPSNAPSRRTKNQTWNFPLAFLFFSHVSIIARSPQRFLFWIINSHCTPLFVWLNITFLNVPFLATKYSRHFLFTLCFTGITFKCSHYLLALLLLANALITYWSNFRSCILHKQLYYFSLLSVIQLANRQLTTVDTHIMNRMKNLVFGLVDFRVVDNDNGHLRSVTATIEVESQRGKKKSLLKKRCF